MGFAEDGVVRACETRLRLDQRYRKFIHHAHGSQARPLLQALELWRRRRTSHQQLSRRGWNVRFAAVRGCLAMRWEVVRPVIASI